MRQKLPKNLYGYIYIILVHLNEYQRLLGNLYYKLLIDLKLQIFMVYIYINLYKTIKNYHYIKVNVKVGKNYFQ